MSSRHRTAASILATLFRFRSNFREDGSDVPIRANTTDLSQSGCYVELMMTLPVGTNVTATLWVSNCSVRMRGRVVTRHTQFGNGIKFLEFNDSGEKVLAQYLDAINLDCATAGGARVLPLDGPRMG